MGSLDEMPIENRVAQHSHCRLNSLNRLQVHSLATSQLHRHTQLVRKLVKELVPVRWAPLLPRSRLLLVRSSWASRDQVPLQPRSLVPLGCVMHYRWFDFAIRPGSLAPMVRPCGLAPMDSAPRLPRLAGRTVSDKARHGWHAKATALSAVRVCFRPNMTRMVQPATTSVVTWPPAKLFAGTGGDAERRLRHDPGEGGSACWPMRLSSSGRGSVPSAHLLQTLSSAGLTFNMARFPLAHSFVAHPAPHTPPSRLAARVSDEADATKPIMIARS